GQVASQVAKEVATQVATQVAAQVAAQVQTSLDNNKAQPTQPAASQTTTTPGQFSTLQNSVVPNNSVFVNPPPIPPTPTPTPAATPPPRDLPGASPGGPGRR
ncbi:MAG: hypothetical protein ORN23_02985, partial [Chthoniobacterales bacterium]|nr:hypothetical protein [Chthoniobacterales bacterium]